MLTYGTPPLHSDVEFSNLHRAGWIWVKEYLDRLVIEDTGKETLFDVYVDTTFSSGKDAFDRPWVGIVHHTWRKNGPNTMTHDLFLSSEFKESLKHCKALLVFTERQASFWRHAFSELSMCIPVSSLTHPTDLNVVSWTPSNYKNNKNKKLLQIGAWMRNLQSIYDISIMLPPGVQATVLQGPVMDDVLAPPDFMSKLKAFLELFETSGNGGICRPTPIIQ
jgi:hypothetical protein